MALEKKDLHRIETGYKKYLNMSKGFTIFLLIFFGSLLFGRLRK